MKRHRKAVLGLMAAVGACLSTGVFATSAAAATGTNVEISQHAAIAATTCYTFVGAEDKNYCNYSRPVNDQLTVGIPANTTQVVIDLKVFPWASPADSIALDPNKDRCVEVSGTALNAKLLETGC
ncbi:hypothetical protein Srufu_029590 [Streptomyces libani subsp. rufus]|nr:hypothetical protein Srufu_029590 [Streptomyces libani subsp. rufus]